MIKMTTLLATSLLSVAILGFSAHAEDKADSKSTAKSTDANPKPSEIEKVSGALELFPEKLYDAKGAVVSRDQLKGKIVGIYFSAHWCPPCKVFTPKLVEFRDKYKDDFEIVFVSSDKDEAAQMGYMKETKMKWLAVKFGSEEIKALKTRYKIRGIPTLIIVGPDGKTITDNGRGDVTAQPAKALKKWKAKAGIKQA